MNGIFAFALWDSKGQKLYLFRDPMGVKPLFYTWCEEELIFASELKGIFAHPLPKPEVDREGWNEIFGIGPARSGGCGVFKESMRYCQESIWYAQRMVVTEKNIGGFIVIHMRMTMKELWRKFLNLFIVVWQGKWYQMYQFVLFYLGEWIAVWCRLFVRQN